MVAMAGKTGFLRTSSIARDGKTCLADRESGPYPKSEMAGEQTWPTQPFPDRSPAVQPADVHRGRHQSSRRGGQDRAAFKERLIEGPQRWPLHSASASSRHGAGPRQQRRFGMGQHGRRSRDRHHVCREPRQPVGPAGCRQPGEGRGGPGGGQARTCPASTCANVSPATGRRAPVRKSGPSLLGGARSASTSRRFASILSTGKGRMPGVFHLTSTDADALAALPAHTDGGGARCRVQERPASRSARWSRRRGRGSGPARGDGSRWSRRADPVSGRRDADRAAAIDAIRGTIGIASEAAVHEASPCDTQRRQRSWWPAGLG